ncbi:heterokaryon incompatibility protein-domain-containing protein [Mariannaea sp. PMI_226]|nr:heterokaryon incompatibility protein-domain-containing protein [Mariannaea sp. PMI_226]
MVANMRLLNIDTWQMSEFISDDEIPQYAILSHTWGDEEISFQQWESKVASDNSRKKGYDKIKKFGEMAASNGFSWVWIDTCCIDKKSSAELSEAINAMFRWYKNAKVCYVYLEDVQTTTNVGGNLRHARWFTRGWTLQELIAPLDVEFYAADWQKIASKDKLCGMLSFITGIDESVLRGGRLDDVSVARRMSWASHRQTSRVEDTAYCLLGIFDVNIPLIYGEGHKAFQRLQEAIMNTTHDQSLFAWGRIVSCPAEILHQSHKLGTEAIPWKPPHERQSLLGLFAESPADFRESNDIAPVEHGYSHHHSRRYPRSIVNRGVLVSLVVYKKLTSVAYWDDPDIAQPHEVELAILLCRFGSKGSQLIGLILHSWGDDYYSRTNELVLVDLFVSQVRFESWTRQRHLLPFRPFQIRNGDILFRRWVMPIKCSWVVRPNTASGPAWRQKCGDRVLRLEKEADGDEAESFMFKLSKTKGFALTFRRLAKSFDPIGPLLIGVSPIEAIERSGIVDEQEKDIPHNWVTKHGENLNTPILSHIMNNSSDAWELDIQGLPRISAKVERILLDGGWQGAVDVVDLVIDKDMFMTQ